MIILAASLVLVTGQLVKNMAGHPRCHSRTSNWPLGLNMAGHSSCYSRTSNWPLGVNMAGHPSCHSWTSNWPLGVNMAGHLSCHSRTSNWPLGPITGWLLKVNLTGRQFVNNSKMFMESQVWWFFHDLYAKELTARSYQMKWLVFLFFFS